VPSGQVVSTQVMVDVRWRTTPNDGTARWSVENPLGLSALVEPSGLLEAGLEMVRLTGVIGASLNEAL
jgi:hypothetical protein